MTLGKDVIDILSMHLMHDLFKGVSLQSARKQQQETSLIWPWIFGGRVNLTLIVSTIVAMGDLPTVVGSDVHGMRTNRVINSGCIADRHKRYGVDSW